MTETVLDALRCIVVALPAAWLTLGVLDNMLHPSINRDSVKDVLGMNALADYPAVEACVGHRRITDSRVIVWLFRLIVAGELAATLLLWLAVVALAGAVFGWVGDGIANTLCLVGLLGFTTVWAAFLIGGQWFYYWYGNHGQHTHMLAALWGLASMAALSL